MPAGQSQQILQRGHLVASFFVSGFCCLTAAYVQVQKDAAYSINHIAACVVVLLDVVGASSGLRKYAT